MKITNSTPQIQVGYDDLKTISSIYNHKYGINFAHYAASSFQRRVVRIMELFDLRTISELTLKIGKDPEFASKFLEEITVNTTEMFRDPLFWSDLREKVLPQLALYDNIHIWHAGCSTGEEVYSMAIMLEEAGLYDRAKIVATDINPTVLKIAKSGSYPKRILNLYNDNYSKYGGKGSLEDYFEMRNGFARMDPSLIRNVSFRSFDLVKGLPFSKFDLIFCRNVLIYFDKVLQDRVSKMFYESLFKHGYFAIGAKESLVWCSVSHKFRSVSMEQKIFRSRM